MTNIIKAGSTVAGLTVSPDQSGALEIRTGMLAGGTPAITIDASQNVTFANNVTVAGTITGTAGLGVGQTWQNLTTSRAKDATYTNSTGKPIMVSVMANLQGIAQGANSLTVNGVLVAYMTQNTAGGNTGISTTMSTIVPAGATYIFTGSGTVTYWSELR